MPITQTRMISLVNSALDYKQAFDRILDLIKSERANVQSGRYTEAAAFRNLEILIQPIGLLTHHAESTATILIEHAHFKSAAARNRAGAKWQANKRRAGGIPSRRDNPDHPSQYRENLLPSTTAPTTLIRQEVLQGSIYQYLEGEVGFPNRTEPLGPQSIVSADPDTLREISGTFSPDPDPFEPPKAGNPPIKSPGDSK